jgi:hypothetical protein
MQAETFVGTVGYRIRLKLGPDAAIGSDPVAIRYQKPGGATGTWTATIEDATEGIIYYDTTSGDLDESGWWHLNGVHDPAGASVFYGNTVRMLVKELGA